MTERIFISYAFQDREYLGQVLGELREHGIVAKDEKIELDFMNNLNCGVNIRPILRERIQRASIVVIFWTKEGAMSQFVNYEAGMADALGKQIILVVPKNQTPGMPISLSGYQSIRVDYKKDSNENDVVLKNCPNYFDPNRNKPRKNGALNPAMANLMDDLFRTLDTGVAKKFFDEIYIEVDQNEIVREKLLEITKRYISRIRSGKGTEPLQPFLITGRVGCGKSALIRSVINKNKLFKTKLPTKDKSGHIVVLVDCRRFKTRDEILEQLLLELTRQCRCSKSIIWPSLQKAGWAKHLTEEAISSMDEPEKLSKLRGVLDYLHTKALSDINQAVPVIFILDNIDRILNLELRRTIVKLTYRESTAGYPFFVIPLRNTTKNIIDKMDDEFGSITSHPISPPSHRELLSRRLNAAFSHGLLEDAKSWSRRQKANIMLNRLNLEFRDLRKICRNVMLAINEGEFIVHLSGTNMRKALTIFRSIMTSLPPELVMKFSRSDGKINRTHELIQVLALEGHPCYFESRSKVQNVFSSIHCSSIFTNLYLVMLLRHLTIQPDDYTSLDKWVDMAVTAGLPRREVEAKIIEMIKGHFPPVEVEGYEDGIPEDYDFAKQQSCNSVRFTTAGRYFFEWLVNDLTYLDCVMQDTIMDADIAESLAKLRTKNPVELTGIFERIDLFLNYLERQENIERATWGCTQILKVTPEIKRRVEYQKRALTKNFS